ncbi:hypothetical protein DFJ66_2887 [Saccharothrix variisporea]|uniref:Uncharacterized protein n=1 Tax=Saccharothrix variisporea TaxID=543527 RepID=A0A495X6M7_9PSEU|nr:hypothetical protein DFJ66_2887 [Saccharothrix variisporea]
MPSTADTQVGEVSAWGLSRACLPRLLRRRHGTEASPAHCPSAYLPVMGNNGRDAKGEGTSGHPVARAVSPGQRSSRSGP